MLPGGTSTNEQFTYWLGARRPRLTWRTDDSGRLPIVRSMRTKSQTNGKLVIESVAFGVGYTAMLIWVGSALVASFTGGEANPYWPVIPFLRTDTVGDLAFVVAIVSLVVSRYLQLRRRGAAPAQPVARLAGLVMVQAMAETAAVLCTAVVIYLSFNAVTHPETLELQLTHLLPGPSEGTARVIVLGICLVAVATSRYLRATAPGQSQPAAVPQNTEPFPSWLCLAGLQYVNGLGELSGAPGAAA